MPGRVAGAMALTFTALAIVACHPAPEPPAPKTIAGADPIIVAIAPSPKGLLITARITEPDLAGDSVRLASRAVRQVARALQAKAPDLPPGATTITFELYGIDVDKFGKRTPARLFAADFDVDDLKTADLSTMGPAKTLNLASDLRIDPAGISPINAWCMRYPHVGTSYCEMAGFGG